MPLPIVQTGHPVLRQKTRELTPEEIASPEVQKLIESMFETMWTAPGVGLAAPQIGVSLAIAVIEDKQAYIDKMAPGVARQRRRQAVAPHVLINPRITIETPAEEEFYEGCLSLVGFTAVVPRALRVKVNALNERGEPVSIDAEGWYARILQHEIDHLNGTLYIDRMHSRTFTTQENFGQFVQPAPLPAQKG
jgi:peptide deformylase